MGLGAQVRITAEDGSKQWNHATTSTGYACFERSAGPFRAGVVQEDSGDRDWLAERDSPDPARCRCGSHCHYYRSRCPLTQFRSLVLRLSRSVALPVAVRLTLQLVVGGRECRVRFGEGRVLANDLLELLARLIRLTQCKPDRRALQANSGVPGRSCRAMAKWRMPRRTGPPASRPWLLRCSPCSRTGSPSTLHGTALGRRRVCRCSRAPVRKGNARPGSFGLISMARARWVAAPRPFCRRNSDLSQQILALGRFALAQDAVRASLRFARALLFEQRNPQHVRDRLLVGVVFLSGVRSSTTCSGRPLWRRQSASRSAG